MKLFRQKVPLSLATVVFLFAVVMAACGSAAEPTEEAPAATAEPANSPAETPASGSAPTGSGDPEPQGDTAPKFTLPSAGGETFALASFAGDKNVVLVFYRGFW